MNLEELEKLHHDQIADHVKNKFILIYNQKFDPKCKKEDMESGGLGAAFFEEQKAYFNNELQGPFKEGLAKASSLSIMNAFMSLAINGLSLEKGLTTDCYLMANSKKIGSDAKGADIYGFMAYIKITGYGEVLIRKRAGQILGIENPTIVYDCDDCRIGERDGHKFVNYEKCMNKPKDARFVACFVKILLKDGGYDYFILDQDGLARLKDYNIKQNHGRFVNPLYGNVQNGWQPDSGFLIAKTIYHAFKGYPKISIGDGAVMQAEADDSATVKIDSENDVSGVKVNTNENDPF